MKETLLMLTALLLLICEENDKGFDLSKHLCYCGYSPHPLAVMDN